MPSGEKKHLLHSYCIHHTLLNLKNNVGGDKIKAGNITGYTSVTAVDPISTGVEQFGSNLPGIEDKPQKKNEETRNNEAKTERSKGRKERRQLRQQTRADLIKQRNVEKLENRTGKRMQERTDRFRTRRGANVVKERQEAIGSSTREVNLNTTAKQLKIMGASKDPSNNDVASANVNWVVVIAEHELKVTTGT